MQWFERCGKFSPNSFVVETRSAAKRWSCNCSSCHKSVYAPRQLLAHFPPYQMTDKNILASAAQISSQKICKKVRPTRLDSKNGREVVVWSWDDVQCSLIAAAHSAWAFCNRAVFTARRSRPDWSGGCGRHLATPVTALQVCTAVLQFCRHTASHATDTVRHCRLRIRWNSIFYTVECGLAAHCRPAVLHRLAALALTTNSATGKHRY